ncbi:MAG: hypothetical protein ACTHM1_11995 [Solirubrobacteraceae bacterium]
MAFRANPGFGRAVLLGVAADSGQLVEDGLQVAVQIVGADDQPLEDGLVHQPSHLWIGG